MSDAVFIFTFSPIQPFIAEARRTADLFAGSQILVALSKAVKSELETVSKSMVYPVADTNDLPNKLVAVIPWEQVDTIAVNARGCLLQTWCDITRTARTYLRSVEPHPDDAWNSIFDRQIGKPEDDPHPYWEIYWAAAKIQDAGYAQAYLEAEQAINSAKRCRTFAQIPEPGIKDNFSGRREALHTKNQDARGYWKDLHSHLSNPSQLRSGERLDAIGAVKRFGSLSIQKHFPSTSSIAARPFLAAISSTEPNRIALKQYREKLEVLLGKQLFKVAESADWPYDGDLLYIDTLVPKVLLEIFPNANIDLQNLKNAREALSKIKGQPSSYYAILALDGDNMGARITAQLEKTDPLFEHQAFSRSLGLFAGAVPGIVAKHQAELVYNGGDDVLALAPLAACLGLYMDLAKIFSEKTQGTASCGITIAHRNFPLGAALKAARQAESRAKSTPDKDALCVRVLKRSGEVMEMRSRRDALIANFTDYQNLLAGASPQLSGRFAYDLLSSTYAFPAADDMLASEIRRLLKRHKEEKATLDAQDWAERLRAWAAALPGGPVELAAWLLLARFITSGGEL